MNSVGSKSKFKRSYLIFANEDAGFEAGQKPSGHVKVEIREGRGKLHAVAQNLRPGNGRFDYVLYILRCGKNSAEPVRAGCMKNKLNKWELEWVFDPIKLGMSGYPDDDGDVIAILAEFADQQEDGVICPLAAYRNKPVEWRSSFRQPELSDETLSVEYLDEPKDGEKTGEDAAVAAEIRKKRIDENETENKSGETQECADAIDTTCIYLNGNMCGALIQAEGGAANPCITCQIRNGVQPSNARLPVDMTQLKAMLGSNFEQSDPFQSKRSDYIWWKITNPVNLNNILYINGIRSPLLFNPAVMIAHYKYSHFIIGTFKHMDGQEYVVCGVPAMHMVDRKPFGELGTWVQTEGSRIRYGAFGYWLVYINPSDGKMLNLNRSAESQPER